MHVFGSLATAREELGVYAGHAEGLTVKPLVDRDAGSVHQALVHLELAPGGRVERHLHAFEQAVYLLSGALKVELAGAREELAADDYVWIEVGVPHSIENASSEPARWLEVSAPVPGADLDDTVFGNLAGAEAELAYRRGRFDVADLPEASGTIGLAGFGGGNVGGASLKMLVDPAFGASQFNLMSLRYVPGGQIKEHDHAFEEAFFFVEGEIEAVLDGETYTLRAGDYCWSSCGGMHTFVNRSDAPVRWIETQVPQPPSRHQARFKGDWERLIGASE